MTTKKSNFPSLAEIAVNESLRDWFKKEKWVRISSSGNIAGPCGTSKNKKNPDRCLPKAKAQSLTKGQRAATAAKKKKAGAKGKTVVKNTKKAKVTKESLWANINAKKKAGKKSSHGNSKAYKAAKKAGKALKKSKNETSNPQDGKAAPYGSGYKPTNMKNKNETKGAPKGHYFTKSGNLVKGRLTKDAREKGARLSDPKDKQRSKVPPVTQYNEGTDLYDRNGIQIKRFAGGKDRGLMVQITYGGKFIHVPADEFPILARAMQSVQGDLKDLNLQVPRGKNIDEAKLTMEDVKNLVAGLLHEAQGKKVLMEKDDRCTRIAKRKYDTWPSAYASGAVVRCRRGEIWKGQK